MPASLRFLRLAACAAPLLVGAPAAGQQSLDLRPERSGDDAIEVSVVAGGLRAPVSIAFLPDGRALVADRPLARLHRLDVRTGVLDAISGLPEIAVAGDGGLHDIVVDAEFATNRTIYVAYTVAGGNDTYALAVDRARLDDDDLTDVQRIFTASPFLEGGEHFGGRMVQSGEHLYITSGDRQHRDLAQRLDNHIGKILRVRIDGGVPDDNPLVGRDDARAEIWSYGHRNPQGLALHPFTGELWAHEHGPRGGDEVNRIIAGANYGWPVLSFGFEYEGGPIGAGVQHREGMEPPAHVYVPSIAPSGLAIYRGDAFAAWRGSMLTGALALRHLNRVVLGENGIRLEERLLAGRGFRIRAVAEAPDGSVLLGVDGGTVLRLAPAAPAIRGTR